MNCTFLLFFILTIPYIGYSQNASDQITGTYVCSKSTGWGNYTNPSTGVSMEVVPLPLWDATLILNKDSTFTRSIIMFSDNRETEEKGDWHIAQDFLILHIKTSKPSYANIEFTSDLEEKLKIDTGSRLLIGKSDVYSKTE
jgi:hypothetical protein